MADSHRGGFELIPQAYSVSYRNDSFPVVEITGIMGRTIDAKDRAEQQLKGFTLLQLMDEVGRRIKSGENIKENMKR